MNHPSLRGSGGESKMPHRGKAEDVNENFPCRRVAGLRGRLGLVSSFIVAIVSSSGFLPLGMGSRDTAAADQGAEVESMKILIPLYARPESKFWTDVVEAGSAANAASVQISAVVNPASGPGEVAIANFTLGIYRLWDAGIEVLCYVPTGFGYTDVASVTSDIDMYQELYPNLCGGFFFDEGPGTDENVWKYTEYYDHAQEVNDYSTVVVNPGLAPDESLFFIGDDFERVNGFRGGQLVIVSFENSFEKFYGQDEQSGPEDEEVPDVPFFHTSWERYRNSMLVYDASFGNPDKSLALIMKKVHCNYWGYVFFTDDSFGNDGNPWNEEPSYLLSLVQAVADASISTEMCSTSLLTTSPSPSVPQKGESKNPTPSPTLVPTDEALSETSSALRPGSAPTTTAVLLAVAAMALGWTVSSMGC